MDNTNKRKIRASVRILLNERLLLDAHTTLAEVAEKLEVFCREIPDVSYVTIVPDYSLVTDFGHTVEVVAFPKNKKLEREIFEQIQDFLQPFLN